MTKIVYILTNEAMPELVKIGATSREEVAERIAELSGHTGVPLPFICHFAGELNEHPENVEKLLHQVFAEYRINPKREFFRIDPEKAVLALRLAQAKDVTPQFQSKPDPEEAKAIEVAQNKRSRTDLAKLGIHPGEKLTFSRDPSITCEVAPGNKVIYQGSTMSSSAAAVLALQSLGNSSTSVSGPDYWMFNNKTISDIRWENEQGMFIDAK